jgi:hypothetical protein
MTVHNCCSLSLCDTRGCSKYSHNLTWQSNVLTYPRLIVILCSRCGSMKVNVRLSVCFNRAPRHEGVLVEWMYSSMHSWARFGPAALPPGKEPLVPLDRRLHGPQSRSGGSFVEKNSQPLSEFESSARSPALYHWANRAPLLWILI